MNWYKSTKEVVKLLESKDNIIEQLQVLRKYQYKKGVRTYIDNLIRANQVRHDDEDSEYILYCIAKYYYGFDVKEVKEPLPRLPLNMSSSSNFQGNSDAIADLLNQKKDIIEQCKLLREHKNMNGVDEYFDWVFEWYGYDVAIANQSRDFETYCINKYYFGLDVPEVKPPHIYLYAYHREKRDDTIIYEDVSDATPFNELNKGDKVEIVNGPFKGVEATILGISEDFKEINLNCVLFGKDTPINLDDDNKMRKIIDDK